MYTTMGRHCTIADPDGPVTGVLKVIHGACIVYPLPKHTRAALHERQLQHLPLLKTTVGLYYLAIVIQLFLESIMLLPFEACVLHDLPHNVLHPSHEQCQILVTVQMALMNVEPTRTI